MLPCAMIRNDSQGANANTSFKNPIMVFPPEQGFRAVPQNMRLKTVHQ